MTPGQTVQAAQACEGVLGVTPGEEHYDVCLASLKRSLSEANADQIVQDAHESCQRQGLRAGSADFAECVLTKAAAGAHTRGQSPVMSRDIHAISNTSRGNSYFYAPPAEVRQRERRVCARLGFDPAYGQFANCVASLSAALFDVDNPSN